MNMHDIANTDEKTIAFSFGKKETMIRLGNFIVADELKRIRTYCTQAIIIADQKANELWGNEVYHLLSRQLPTQLYTVNAVETEKTLSTVCRLLEAIIQTGPSRSCAIVSFGGGLTGNIAGVVAGLLFRGVQLIHIPTTLLAMSDSILSQKQAVNGPVTKNSFGLYHKAALNILDIKYLSSLDPLHIFGGIIEIVKNCLAFDPGSINALREILSHPITPEGHQFLVNLGITQKQQLLQKDPYEKENGIILEYGHTIGHSLEITMGNLHHGQAVGLGMLAAAYISLRRNWITEDDLKLHAELLQLCFCPSRIPAQMDINKVMASVKSDNKKGKIAHGTGETPMVLLKGIGKVGMSNESYLVPVTYGEIEEAVLCLKTGFFEM